jgi:anti-anti-sigma factor
LDSAATLRGPLLDQLHAPGPVTLDLRSLDYLSSAGVGLIIDAIRHTATQHTSLRLQLTPRSLAARVLALTGLERTVPLVTDATVS